MKLTVVQHRGHADPVPASTLFQAPGGTLGRAAENHLPLPDNQRRICRIQAAIRISEQACYLVNLSNMSEVSLNGRRIARDQEIPLAHGDELTVGPYVLKAQDPARLALADEPDPLLESPLLDDALHEARARLNGYAAAPAGAAASLAMAPPLQAVNPDTLPGPALGPAPLPAAAPPASVAPQAAPLPEPDAVPPEPLFPDTAPANDSADVFSDLFGPGTLPVGSAPDVSAHPFDLDSAQSRNPEDPLHHLPPGNADVTGAQVDPLEMFEHPDDHYAQDVFADTTPSTLPSHDPLAPHRVDPLGETLNRARDDSSAQAARDHRHEYGAYLRPAQVRQETPPGKPDGNAPDNS